MAFDDIPEDREPSFPCDCGGNVTLQPNGHTWECDECPFATETQIHE